MIFADCLHFVGSVLQCVSSVLQCVAVRCSGCADVCRVRVVIGRYLVCSVLPCDVVYCSLLQFVAVCCSVFQYG